VECRRFPTKDLDELIDPIDAATLDDERQRIGGRRQWLARSVEHATSGRRVDERR
jgi:hypothetical protein